MRILIPTFFGLSFLLAAPLAAQPAPPERLPASPLPQLSVLHPERFLYDQQALPDSASPTDVPSSAGQSDTSARTHGSRHGDSMPAGSEYPSFHLVGFGDFDFFAANDSASKSGFNEGQFVLHFSSALSERVSFVGELSFTARSDAGTGTPPATGFNAEVERAIIRFDQSDYLKLSLGRYHTPINWWNTAFHHGLWLQTTISRPEMTKFGGQFIPVHFVGGLIEGALPLAGLNLNYNAGLGNGRGSVISRGGDAGDNNDNRAWLVNLFIKPDALFGMQLGGSAYRDKITFANGREYHEWIWSGHLVWQKEDPEFIAEVANVQHSDVATDTRRNNLAYYVQLAYRLPILDNTLKPYVRYEDMNIDENDEVFSALYDEKEYTAGLRYDISDFAALKGEYRRYRLPAGKNVDALYLQVCYTF